MCSALHHAQQRAQAMPSASTRLSHAKTKPTLATPLKHTAFARQVAEKYQLVLMRYLA
jgi:hypothetical protein